MLLVPVCLIGWHLVIKELFEDSNFVVQLLEHIVKVRVLPPHVGIVDGLADVFREVPIIVIPPLLGFPPLVKLRFAILPLGQFFRTLKSSVAESTSSLLLKSSFFFNKKS